jgi:hypothetical protein
LLDIQPLPKKDKTTKSEPNSSEETAAG